MLFLNQIKPEKIFGMGVQGAILLLCFWKQCPNAFQSVNVMFRVNFVYSYTVSNLGSRLYERN